MRADETRARRNPRQDARHFVHFRIRRIGDYICALKYVRRHQQVASEDLPSLLFQRATNAGGSGERVMHCAHVDSLLIERAQNEWEETRFVADVPHDAKRARTHASPFANGVKRISRTNLRWRQNCLREDRNGKSVRRIQRSSSSVGHFLVARCIGMHTVEARVLPIREIARQQFGQTERSTSRDPLRPNSREVHVRPAVLRGYSLNVVFMPSMMAFTACTSAGVRILSWAPGWSVQLKVCA